MAEPHAHRPRNWSLGARLGTAFATIAVLAVGLVVGLVIITTSRETARLAAAQRQQAATTAATTLARAYRRDGGWGGGDVAATARRLALQAGGGLTVLDAQGRTVASVGSMPGAMGPGMGAGSVEAPVTVGDRTVGDVVLRLPGSGLSRSEQRLRDRLVTIALVGGGIAVLMALAAALYFARRLTAPLRRLTSAARRLERGEQAPGAVVDAPGEIGELARAFDHMARALDDQARSRQATLTEIAHELRTPLTILRGNCEAMVDGVEQPSPDRLASLHDEILRLERLVADLETLSASEAAFAQLDLTTVDLADLARSAVALLSGQAASAGVALGSDVVATVLQGDRSRLEQILENLISNALKFTPRGGTITVRTFPEGDDAVLEVRDTGRGIPPDELPHVFERFWRGTRAADTGGRGIGLAVVDELVRAHHGQVSVTSVPGRGSVFTARFPALRAPD